jgi:prepilin-type N-terminal cleavage/methylation domain-containing protein
MCKCIRGSKQAFTMIETIFVIVIIGILAATAIPKLVATRDDANAVKIVNALSVCINDAGNEYIRTGSFHGFTHGVNATVSCQFASECFDFLEDDDNGTLSVDGNTSADSKACQLAKDIASKNVLSTIHNFYF